jgi:hypothetical protein
MKNDSHHFGQEKKSVKSKKMSGGGDGEEDKGQGVQPPTIQQRMKLLAEASKGYTTTPKNLSENNRKNLNKSYKEMSFNARKAVWAPKTTPTTPTTPTNKANAIANAAQYFQQNQIPEAAKQLLNTTQQVANNLNEEKNLINIKNKLIKLISGLDLNVNNNKNKLVRIHKLVNELDNVRTNE